jgi:hypothetical protein
MKQTLMLLNEEDWTLSLNSNGKNLEALRPRDPIRNMAVALIMSGYYQMFDPLRLLVYISPENWRAIGKNTLPFSIKSKTEVHLINGQDYNILIHWFLKENSEEAFSFEHCCSVMGISMEMIRERIIFLKKCREEIIDSTIRDINPKSLTCLASFMKLSRFDFMKDIKNKILDMKKNGTTESGVLSFSKPIYVADKMKNLFKDKFSLEKC